MTTENVNSKFNKEILSVVKTVKQNDSIVFPFPFWGKAPFKLTSDQLK